MRRLCLCSSAVVVLLGGVRAAHAQPSNSKGVVVAADRIGDFVNEASQRFAIPPSWIRAVMRVESLGDPLALSPKGAMGLMQIMPDTWSELRSRYGLGADPYDAHDNIMAGAAYLREMHDRYGESGFLAAYNAGPSRYEDHLATGRPLPSATLLYMAAVASLVGARVDEGGEAVAVLAASWTTARLFVTRLAAGSLQSRPTSSAQMPKALVGETAQNRTELVPLSHGLFAKLSARDGRP
jgi:soluble lytic murein transglycosylase-like protein